MSLLTNIVAYYKLSDTSDATGNSNTLTNNNSVTFDAGLIGNAADLGSSNTNKFLSIASDFGINGGNITISLWVKLNAEIASSTWGFAYMPANSPGIAYGIVYEYNSGTRRIHIERVKFGGAGADIYTTVTLGTSTWHHIVLTYDGTNLISYLDGIASSPSATSGTGVSTGTTEFDLGNTVTSLYASTKIDEAGVWSRALSSTEVTQLYNSGVGLQYPFTTAYTLSCTAGSYSVTGGTNIISKLKTLICQAGSYAITGINVVLKFFGWKNQTKHSTSFTNNSKSSTNWTNIRKS